MSENGLSDAHLSSDLSMIVICSADPDKSWWNSVHHLMVSKVCGSQKKTASDSSPSVCWPNRFFCSVHYSVFCSSAFVTQWWCHCNLHEKFLSQISHSSLCNVSVLECIANLVINYPWRIASVQQMYPGSVPGVVRAAGVCGQSGWTMVQLMQLEWHQEFIRGNISWSFSLRT